MTPEEMNPITCEEFVSSKFGSQFKDTLGNTWTVVEIISGVRKKRYSTRRLSNPRLGAHIFFYKDGRIYRREDDHLILADEFNGPEDRRVS